MFASVRTGITLLILVVIASAVGTLVLQRPQTDPEQLQRAYAPETLRWLDALRLTDVFHSWWFVGLLALLCVNIVLASLERLPNAWRCFAHPYRRPEPHFLAALTLQKQMAMSNAEAGLEAAQSALRRMGFHPQRVENDGRASIFAERNRASRLAAYVVHASLLLILGGGIADALWGWRGYLTLTQNQQTNQIDLRDATRKTLPFTIRCDGAGQENYPDGSPRRWWSKLVVLEDGREVKRKEVEVNEPLIHRGLRFYQSGYGSTGELGGVQLRARLKSDLNSTREVLLRPGETLPVDAETSVRLAAFVPDFIIRGNRVETRSDQPNNPAIQLALASRNSGEALVWLFPRYPDFSHPNASPYIFEVRDIHMGYFTGLQVSREPGQWAVWAGVILMGLGLAMAFYFVHVRIWALPVSDDRGRLVLWVGASASKNREEFAERFATLVEEIQRELRTAASRSAAASQQAHPARRTARKAATLVNTSVAGERREQWHEP